MVASKLRQIANICKSEKGQQFNNDSIKVDTNSLRAFLFNKLSQSSQTAQCCVDEKTENDTIYSHCADNDTNPNPNLLVSHPVNLM